MTTLSRFTKIKFLDIFENKGVLLPLFFLVAGLISSTAQQVVPFSPRLDGDNINIKGDYTFLSNGILNRVDANNTTSDPYNGTSDNNNFHRDYIDIDGDASTFSSSSASLALPACSKVEYAGLYWSANYEQEVKSNSAIASLPTNDTRRLDFSEVKFKLPGGSYIDLSADTDPDPAGEEDDIIFDDVNFEGAPYTCYKNVTSLVQTLADPNGEYTLANVRAMRGRTPRGAGGWTLVIIYENPNESSKYISVFDGYAGVGPLSASSALINVSGFRTIPNGVVNLKLGVSAVEGDRAASGDRFRIRTPTNPSVTSLSNAANPANNFFNSSITVNGSNVLTRSVPSTNSLGYDSDVFRVNNPNNGVIANNETEATLELFTSGENFGSFLIVFGVDIIEPDIVLEKRVKDIAGNDVTGLGVNLGQTLDYELSFRNVGNDDARGIYH